MIEYIGKRPAMRTWLAFTLAVLALVAVSLIGSGFMPGPWYEALQKPAFNPPSWLFGPVWGVMYLLNAVALGLVLKARRSAARNTALLAFAVQLVLNAAWTPVFFGAQSIGGALLVIVALLAAIVWTILAAGQVRRWAGHLLWPYLAWVGFATVLNASIWLLNRAG